MFFTEILALHSHNEFHMLGFIERVCISVIVIMFIDIVGISNVMYRLLYGVYC